MLLDWGIKWPTLGSGNMWVSMLIRGFVYFLAKIEISQVVHNLYDIHVVVQYEDPFPFLLRDIELGIYFMNIQYR